MILPVNSILVLYIGIPLIFICNGGTPLLLLVITAPAPKGQGTSHDLNGSPLAQYYFFLQSLLAINTFL